MRRQQVLPARGRGRRQLCIGLRLQHPGAGLCQLLVQIGAVDQRQHLTRLHLAADIALPALEVAVHPRLYGRFAPGLKVGWQAQGVAPGVLPGLEHAHHRQGSRLRPLADRLLMPAAARQSVGHQQGGQRQAADAQVHQARVRRCLIRRHGAFLQQRECLFARAPS